MLFITFFLPPLVCLHGDCIQVMSVMSVFSETGENIIENTWRVEFSHKLEIQVSSKTKNDIGRL